LLMFFNLPASMTVRTTLFPTVVTNSCQILLHIGISGKQAKKSTRMTRIQRRGGRFKAHLRYTSLQPVRTNETATRIGTSHKTLLAGGLAAGVGVFAQAGPGCVTKDFYMGLDVAYLKVDGMSTTTGTVLGPAVVPQAFTATGVAGPNNATVGFKAPDNESIWLARFRVHRDFYP
jgi:hypothetical protein